MLDNINSNYISKNILEYIPKKTALIIFKYSKFYHSKFNINTNDYLFEFFRIISKDLYDDDFFIEKEPDKNYSEHIFKTLKSKLSHDIPNEILKENIIKYFALQKDYLLSINHIYFNEIIREIILLGKSNVKIEFNFEDYLSQNNIIDLITQKNSDEKIINYINEKMELNYNIINKLETLLNSNIVINEIYFKLKHSSICCIDYEEDIIEYKENEANEEKNILIDFKLKRAELINKILDKYCKYITKMKYVIFEKKLSENIKVVFPLVDLDKFENLLSLDLFILYKGRFDEELNFNFTSQLNKLKSLEIYGNNLNNDFYPLSVKLQKKMLDQLEILKVNNVNWYISNEESFHLKNIKNLCIHNCFFPEKSQDQKKYFFKELLKGNISWEKLEKFNISLNYGYEEEDKEEYINKKIIYFLKIANQRGYGYETDSEFFQKFFNFIFKNQNIYIKTNEPNKNIEEFQIELYDLIGCWTCNKHPIIYEKKGKNVNLTINGNLFGYPIPFYDGGLEESPLKFINLDNIKIDPHINNFTIEDHTVKELNEIKKYLLKQYEKIEIFTKDYKIFYDNYKEKYIDENYNDNNLQIEINELKKKETNLKNQRDLLLRDCEEENNFGNIMTKINALVLENEINQIKKLRKDLEKLQKKK